METLNKPSVHATLVLKLKQLSKQKNSSGRFRKLLIAFAYCMTGFKEC